MTTDPRIPGKGKSVDLETAVEAVNKLFEDQAEKRFGRRHRDPERVARILEKLRAFWLIDTDLRLGQIISNLKGLGQQDVFYFEDDDLEKALDDAFEAMRQSENLRFAPGEDKPRRNDG